MMSISAGGAAGSVASLSYVENGITDTLEEVPKEKLINSVPLYTRVWTEKTERPHQRLTA